MTIAFSCSCGATLSVPEGMAGTKGKCPTCGKALAVPAPGGDGTNGKGAPAKKPSETFALASSDLSESKDIAVSGDSSPDEGDGGEAAAGPAAPAAPGPAKARAPGKKTPVMRFRCPHCKRTLTVPLSVAGQTGRCGGCSQRFRAPIPEVVQQLRAKLAPKAEPSLRETFSVVKVTCTCGMTSAVPKSRIAGGAARCPACDRNLAFDLSLESGAGGDADES